MAVHISDPVKADIESTSTRSRIPLFERFEFFADQWKRDTGHLSNISKKCRHPAYQEIIKMGKEVVPLILADLKVSKADWFWALTTITSENPIMAENAGDINQMVEAWLQWGKTQGYDV